MTRADKMHELAIKVTQIALNNVGNQLENITTKLEPPFFLDLKELPEYKKAIKSIKEYEEAVTKRMREDYGRLKSEQPE